MPIGTKTRMRGSKLIFARSAGSLYGRRQIAAEFPKRRHVTPLLFFRIYSLRETHFEYGYQSDCPALRIFNFIHCLRLREKMASSLFDRSMFREFLLLSTHAYGYEHISITLVEVCYRPVVGSTQDKVEKWIVCDGLLSTNWR